MPNIREFDNQADHLTPDNGMEQVAARNAQHTAQEYEYAGHAIGGGIEDAGHTYDRIKTQQDISAGLSQKAQILSNITTAWDVTSKNADPNDHSTADKFRAEQLEPILDAWTTGFSTEDSRKWAEENAAQIRQHMYEKTAADQSLMAGEAAKQNIHDTVTGLSNLALQDPASLNMALGTLDNGIEALVGADPNITPAHAAAMRGELRDAGRLEIGKAAAIGTARTNPDQAMQDIQSGKYAHILDATTSNQMFGFAESIKREQRSDARADYAMNKEKEKQDFDHRMTALTVSLFQPDGSTAVPPGFHQQLATLALMPGADASAIRAAGDAAKTAVEDKINGKLTVTNNQTWQGLAGRIGDANHPITHAQVDQAYAAGNLSEHDWHFLHQAVETAHNDPATTAAMTQINQSLERNKTLVTQSNLYSGHLDQSGDQLYDDMHFDTFQRFQQLQAGGMSATEAAKVITDPRDPRGIQANLSPYQTNNKAGLQAIHQRVSAGGGPTNVQAPALTTARKAGESAADYLKRTSK